MSTNLLVSTFSPFSTLSIAVPSETRFSSVLPLLNAKYPSLPTSGLVLSPHLGFVDENSTVGSLCDEHESLVSLRLSPRLLGGKGGFGSQLRAAGGRMSSQKTSNNDSCRDLNGRRLSTIKEAKKLAEYLESEPERLAAKAEAQKAKLEALERKLGITPSASSSKAADSSEPPKLAGTKHRFDDTEYLEQSRELVDGVKSAVSAALLKKKKKAKLSPTSTPAASEDKKELPKVAAKEVVKEPPAAAPPVSSVEAIGA